MKYTILIALVLGLMGCSEKKSKPDTQSQLDALFAKQIKPEGAGFAVLISVNDTIIYNESHGYANLRSKEKITSKTLFNLGSISKTFVMNSILMLRDEGKLSLEDSLIKYFPEFKNKEIAKKVKIKHLLTHTSGLPDNRPVSDEREFYLTADDAQNWHPVTQTDTLEFEPGTRYNYSNPAYNGLALIIEKVTNQNWREFVSERIFKPAGMTTSTITDGPHPERGVAHGYVYDESGARTESDTTQLPRQWNELDFGEEPTFCAAGNGGVWSSVEELLMYYKAMETVSFSKAETIAESKEIKTFPQWKSAEAPFIGWSWFVGKTPGGLKTVGHTGTQGGFYCDYLTVPEKKMVYILCANFPIDRDWLAPEVLKKLGL